MSNSPLFSDRITNITVTGPLVRIELGSAKLPLPPGQQAEFESHDTLVMPLEGFLTSYSTMEAVMKKMIAEGIVKPREEVQ